MTGTAAERELPHAAATGTLVDMRAGDAQINEPAQGAAWSGERTVRAQTLVELLTGQRGGRLRAVKLRGARITGQLDLSACVLECPLVLRDCYFDEPVILTEAAAQSIRFPGCDLPELAAGQLRTSGDFDLGSGVRVRGGIDLAGARIGGSLDLDGASLARPLEARALTVDQDVSLTYGFTVEGWVNLRGARIGGRLDLAGGRAAFPQGNAVDAGGLLVEGDMSGCDGFTATGQVVMEGARVRGVLDFDGAGLTNPDGWALAADGLVVEQDLYCREGFTAHGEVRLVGAQVGGALDFSGARLANPGVRAVSANRLRVGGDLTCGGQFSAEGEIVLSGARIGGNLDLSGARLSNPGGVALRADSLAVTQCVFCRDGFSADGQVRMLSARIGEAFSLEGATLNHPEGDALYAVLLTVDGALFGRRGLTVRGSLQLSGSRIANLIDLSGTLLSHPGRQVLDLYAASTAELQLLPRQTPDGVVNLTNAQVGIFEDDPSTWPDTILLRGFSYDRLHNDKADVRARLRWLRRDPDGYVPQIYDQLAAAYRRTGREDAARQVAIAKQRQRRAVQGRLGKLTNWLLYLTVGYGYRTWLAAPWLGALLAVGTWVFAAAHPRHMLRTDPHGPAFNALAYTLDVVLPVGDLGQQNTWQPEGTAMYWSWAFMAAGWLLTTAVVAGLTGILKRE